jgi:hypothetical protein
MLVKCIDNLYWENVLILNKYYRVEKDNENFWSIPGCRNIFYKGKFEIVDNKITKILYG